MKHILSIKGLEKKYGKKTVVKNISFSMESGQVIGLLGPNGAGKTTTFYMIVGFIKANNGKIYLDEKDITSLAMHKRAKAGLSYLPQEPSIFRKLSVENNIKLVIENREDLDSKQKNELLEKLLIDFGLTQLRKQPGYTLSGGERRRCEIARSLATSPHFLLLDEPFAGIDPKAVSDIKIIIKELSKKGIGILLTDHNVRDTLSITHCSYIINNGALLTSGDKETLLNDEKAINIYFGSTFEEDQ
ncbi:MAG: LPS export ABC transporter ATP-binding protein [Sphaerochaetaceae bacterium]|nr:LPS export ABC transporter ATP-binding protein [Sphaerochaetaceae bacterium]MDC7237500.1 LPS export ABC transporter ATP-binding protein [Sphaerochaetaceae bacterium]MDC7248484.1 LPS export ABC transporter ATP-binding protein [Sphaerochaetaceae bacterium]